MHCDRLDQRDFVSHVVGKYLLDLKVDDNYVSACFKCHAYIRPDRFIK